MVGFCIRGIGLSVYMTINVTKLLREIGCEDGT
jgi:hypothetical protein